jgi:hypothetical protein
MNKVEEPVNLSELAENMKRLVEEYYSLQKKTAGLTLIRYLAKTGGATMDGVIRVILVAAVFVFASVTCALWLGKITGSLVNGFGLMTIILLILSLIIHALRKSLFVNPLVHRLIRKLYNDTERSNTDYDEEQEPHQ